MNPINEYSRTYITACFTIAVIYAFAFGGSLYTMSELTECLLFHLIDGLIYGAILYLTGIILWNIFRFAIPAYKNLTYHLLFVCAITIITSLFIVSVESLIIFLSFPSIFEVFVHSIPARIFVAILFVVIFRLFYLFNHEKSKFNSNDETNFSDKEFQKNTITSNYIQEKEIKENVENSSAEKTTPEQPSDIDFTEKFIPNQSMLGKAPNDRITVRSGQNIKLIPIDDIIFIKADGDYISINTANGHWLKEQTMKYTEYTLPADRFLRIHRSYIVNVNHISRIERYGEKQLIVLHNNEKIKISAARYQVLKRVLEL